MPSIVVGGNEAGLQFKVKAADLTTTPTSLIHYTFSVPEGFVKPLEEPTATPSPTATATPTSTIEPTITPTVTPSSTPTPVPEQNETYMPIIINKEDQ